MGLTSIIYNYFFVCPECKFSINVREASTHLNRRHPLQAKEIIEELDLGLMWEFSDLVHQTKAGHI